MNDRQLANSVLDAKLKALGQEAHLIAMERIAGRLLKRGGYPGPQCPRIPCGTCPAPCRKDGR